ncbi:MAG: VanZ family protein [Clostridia bacterium]|nr:VanZ family protein [Clostridia bacterium]
MIERTFAYFLGAILFIFYLVLSFVTKRPLGRKILISLFILYITAVASITLFPIIVDPPMPFTDKIIKLIPFSTISEMLLTNSDLETTFLQIGGNIIMCIPFGAAIPFIIKHKKWYHYLLIGLTFPVLIELTQLLISVSINSYYRTIDIDDVILNFLGIMIGYGIYKILPRFTKEFFHAEKETKEE